MRFNQAKKKLKFAKSIISKIPQTFHVNPSERPEKENSPTSNSIDRDTQFITIIFENTQTLETRKMNTYHIKMS